MQPVWRPLAIRPAQFLTTHEETQGSVHKSSLLWPLTPPEHGHYDYLTFMRHPQCSGGKGKAVWQPQHNRKFLCNSIKVLLPSQISSFTVMFRSLYKPEQKSLNASCIIFNPSISRRASVNQNQTKENLQLTRFGFLPFYWLFSE